MHIKPKQDELTLAFACVSRRHELSSASMSQPSILKSPQTQHVVDLDLDRDIRNHCPLISLSQADTSPDGSKAQGS
jgi:hypothetical protein